MRITKGTVEAAIVAVDFFWKQHTVAIALLARRRHALEGHKILCLHDADTDPVRLALTRKKNHIFPIDQCDTRIIHADLGMRVMRSRPCHRRRVGSKMHTILTPRDPEHIVGSQCRGVHHDDIFPVMLDGTRIKRPETWLGHHARVNHRIGGMLDENAFRGRGVLFFHHRYGETCGSRIAEIHLAKFNDFRKVNKRNIIPRQSQAA